MRTISTAALVLALALPIAGCGSDDEGGGGDEEQIREAATRFEDAIEAKDTEAFCRELAPSDVDRIGGERRCLSEYAPKRNILFNAEDTDMSVEEVEIEGDAATAELANQGFLTFRREEDTWYVTLGAAP